MAQIFTTVPFKQSKFNNGTSFNNELNLSNVLEPANGYGEMDIINKFHWTLTPLNEITTKEVPYIRLTEYFLLDNYLNQLFKAYGRSINGVVGVANAFLNPFTLNGSRTLLYEGLYDHVNPTGFSYKFPYFTNDYLSTNNSWTAKAMFKETVKLQKLIAGYGGIAVGGSLGGLGGLLIAAIRAPGPLPAKLAAVAAAIPTAKLGKKYAERGLELEKFTSVAQLAAQSPIANLEDPAIDKPYLWSTTTPRTFNITFPLYNNMSQPAGTNWYANIVKNWELCHLLCYQNLYNKRNLFTGLPPVFYEIDIPGIHYSKAGYVNNLQILNAGNIRKLSLPLEGGTRDVNVPDAYIVNMSITDFFIPSKNFMSSLGVPKDQKGSIVSSSYEFDSLNQNELTESFGDLDPYNPNNPNAPINPNLLPGTYLPGCWVAREVYGITDIRWIIFRDWLYNNSGPKWLQKLYTKYGEQFARFISNKPKIKNFVKTLMNIVVNKQVK